MRSIDNEVTFITSIAPKSCTATETGSAVDVTGGEGAAVVFDIGVTGGTLSTANKITLSVQKSVNGSTFTDVDAADLVGTLPVITSNDDDGKVYSVGYIGNAPYLRAVCTWGGTHTTPVAAGVLLGKLFVSK